MIRLARLSFDSLGNNPPPQRITLCTPNPQSSTTRRHCFWSHVAIIPHPLPLLCRSGEANGGTESSLFFPSRRRTLAR